MDWLDLLAAQGTLKSLLQHHSSKASILWCPAFFIVQLSHPYVTTGKNIALTRWTCVDKVMSLLFNMLSRLDHINESWVFDEGSKLSTVTPDSVRAPNGAHFPLGEGSSVGQDTWGWSHPGPAPTQHPLVGPLICTEQLPSDLRTSGPVGGELPPGA